MTTSEQTTTPVTGERADLLAALAKQRHFLTFPTRDLTDDQARQHTTASELCLGGLIKHVTEVERGWAGFILKGPAAMPDFTAMTEDDWAARERTFQLGPDETLAGVLAAYEETARATDELVATVADLDHKWPLPKAPWNEPGAEWSIRQVLIHIVAETAQHSGHADIIRESLDGSKSMG
ncbi:MULTISPECIES: DinB family protein [unclassified Streptomyces]|uniref:DinB family protein n=1 Tax=unclassified Streptomyces TaxID=2593676 RepID=UPI00278BC580|nr:MULTISPECIES: DinB family protein [unclassified Streptomyces]